MSSFEKGPHESPNLHPLAILYGSETGTAQVGENTKLNLLAAAASGGIAAHCLYLRTSMLQEQGMQQQYRN